MDDHYRAIYLKGRSLNDLVSAVAAKCAVDAARINETTRVNAAGLQIKVEDEMVHEMPEGQDFIAEFDIVEDTPDSAEQFLQLHDDDETPQPHHTYTDLSYRLTLRY